MTEHILYIMMRTDLDSLNPGKAMAQANHAYGALKAGIKKNAPMRKPYLAWQDSTDQDFGTTIVLGGHEGGINSVIAWAYQWMERTSFEAGWVTDPSYPIKDGRVTHLIPLKTCGFIFGQKGDISHAVRSLNLHP